jgi:hypothetical protein
MESSWRCSVIRCLSSRPDGDNLLAGGWHYSPTSRQEITWQVLCNVMRRHETSWDGTWRYVTVRDGTWRYVTVRDRTWRYVMVPDGTWRYVTVRGGTWWYMTVRDGMWRYVTVCDSTWRCVTVRDGTWRNVTVHDGTWRCITGATLGDFCVTLYFTVCKSSDAEALEFLALPLLLPLLP